MNGVSTAILVGVAAAFGAQLRYCLEILFARRHAIGKNEEARQQLPWAILVANVLGSAFTGALAGGVATGKLDPLWLVIGGAGLAGGLTTFSTWTFDTVRAWASGSRWIAVGNVALNICLGLAFAIIGYYLSYDLA